jgi:hypothetical protein
MWWLGSSVRIASTSALFGWRSSHLVVLEALFYVEHGVNLTFAQGELE